MTPRFADLNPSAGFRIATGLAKIGMVLRSRAWQEGFAQDLTPTQGQVLAHLELRPGSTLSEVAAALGVRASTASEAVAVLERKGFISKERQAEDGRRLALLLTPAGQEQARRVATWPDFLASVVESMTAEEQATLVRLLQRLIRELQLRGEIPLARLCSTCVHFRPFVHPDREQPHHCTYVDLPFGDRDLRLDCPEHQAAPPPQAEASWQRFIDPELASG